MSTFDIDSEIRLTVSGEKSLSQLSKALIDAGEDLDVVEVALAETAKQMLTSDAAAKNYAQTVRKLGQELNKLNKQAGRATLRDLTPTQRGDIRAAATDNRAQMASQASYEAYVKASNQRIAAAEAAEIKRITALNRAERAKQAAAAQQAGAAKVAAAKAEARAAQQARDDLINLRYAQYDAASAYTSIGIAAGALVSISAGVGASMERSFASVARTTGATGDQLKGLRSELTNLTTEIPKSFGDIADVATIGAQLDVANEDLADFTATVVKFASTTNVSVEETAMSIGRIAQLTGTAGSDYERLASSIYQTGVTAVATEGEILAVTSEIATAGDLAGFANHEIVALASSLASLGVQPEGARGSIMRIFGLIDKAVANGGESLDRFTRLSNMSADEFVQSWSNDPQKAFTAFIQGLQAVDQAGGSMKATIKDLGVSQVRDEKLLSLLANNYEVYAQAIDETATAYVNGTALQEGYEIQTKTLIDTLVLLKNSFLAANGEGAQYLIEGLAALAKNALDISEAFRGFMSTDVGKTLTAVTVAATAGVAIWAAYNTATALLRGNIAALVTAKQKLNGTSLATNGSLMSLVKTYVLVAAGSEKAAAGVLNHTGAMRGEEVQATKTSVALRAKTAAAKAGSIAMAALPGAAAMAALSLALYGAAKAYEAFQRSRMSALEKSQEDYGDLGGLKEAMAQDMQVYEETGQKVRDVTVTVEKSSTKIYDWAEAAGTAVGAQVQLNDATSKTTKSTEEFTAVIGENAQAMLNQAALNRAIAFYDEFKDILDETGFSLDNYAVAMATTGSGADELRNAFLATLNTTERAKAQIDLLRYISRQSTVLAASGDSEGAARLQAWAKALKMADEQAQGMSAETKEAARQTALLGAISKATAGDMADLNEEMDPDVPNSYASEVATLGDVVRDLSGAAGAVSDVNAALYDLGAAMAENGLDFSNETEAGRANLGALTDTINAMASAAGEDAAALGTNVAILISNLQDQGVAIGDEMSWVLTLLNTTVGNDWGVDFSTEAARSNIRKLIADLIAQQEALNAAAQAQVSYQNAFRTESAKQIGVGTVLRPGVTENNPGMAPQIDTSGLRNLLDQLNASAGDATRQAGQMAQGFDSVKRSSGGAARNTKDLAKNTKEATKEIRTFSDYASDLGGVLQRAFELRFGVGQAKRDVNEAIRDIRAQIEDAEWPSIDELLSSAKHRSTFARRETKDAVISMFRDLKQGALEAKQAVTDALNAVRETKATLAGLKSDESTLLFWRKVAVDYGNVERVMEIDAELAKNRADQATATTELARQEAELAAAREASNNKSLTGNSDGAIKNRENVRGLVNEHLAYIQSLKDTGASQATIDKAVAQSYEDFMAQGKALGYSTSELKDYGDAIKDSGKQNEAQAMSQSEIATALEDVMQGYMDVAVQMAANGASQKEINEYLQKGKKRVEDLAKELGASPEQTKKATDGIQGMIDVVGKLPRNVNVTIKALTPEEAALKEWLAAYNNKTVNLKAQGTGSVAAPTGGWPSIKVPVSSKGAVTADKVTLTDKVIAVSKAVASVVAAKRNAKGKTGTIEVSKATATAVDTIAKTMGIPKAEAKNLLANLITVATEIKTPKVKATEVYANQLTGAIGGTRPKRWGGIADGTIKAFARGGSVMNSRSVSRGRDTVHALLDPKEFVMTREAHSYYGTDLLTALNERRIPKEFNIPVPVMMAQSQNNGLQAVELVQSSVNRIVNGISSAIAASGGNDYAAFAQTFTKMNDLRVSTGRG